LESGRRRGLRQSHDKFAHGPIKGSLKTAKGRLKNLKESSQLVVVKQKNGKTYEGPLIFYLKHLRLDRDNRKKKEDGVRGKLHSFFSSYWWSALE
jgi:hypothetical protein